MRNFLHHLFFPRESNNHRAKLLHHKSLLVLLIALLFCEGFLIATEKKYDGVLGISANVSVDELLSITNQKRAENGLPPLSLNSELSSAATAKASDMFTKNYWAHVAPDGATPWGFIRGAGYEYIYAGENLARGYTTASDVVNAWMASPGHRENMLSANYKDVGFAIQTGTLTGDETVLVVEEFGSKVGESIAKDVSAPQTVQEAPTSIPTPVVTRTIIAQISLSPSPTAIPSPVPTQGVQKSPGQAQRFLVASFQSNPLVDENSLKRQIVIGISGILLITFIIDVILIERRKIARLFTHDIDHIIFFSILLLVIMIIGRGAIL